MRESTAFRLLPMASAGSRKGKRMPKASWNSECVQAMGMI